MLSIKATLFIGIFVLTLLHPSQSSGNGLLWKCDEDVLSSENECIFVRTDDKPFGPHNCNTEAFKLGYAEVVDGDQKTKNLSGRPFDYCDTVEETSTLIEGDDQKYVQLFEMMAPVYDYSQFAPGDLGNNHWEDATQMLVDCEVKMDSNLEGSPKEQWLSVADIKKLMEDPEGKDIHNQILKFLEEAQNELACIMMSSGDWDKHGHCDAFRDKRLLLEGESSNCWEQHYTSMNKGLAIQFNPIVKIATCTEEIDGSGHYETKAGGTTGEISEEQSPPSSESSEEESSGEPPSVSSSEGSDARGPPPSSSEEETSRGPPADSSSEGSDARGPPPSSSEGDSTRGPPSSSSEKPTMSRADREAEKAARDAKRKAKHGFLDIELLQVGTVKVEKEIKEEDVTTTSYYSQQMLRTSKPEIQYNKKDSQLESSTEKPVLKANNLRRKF